MKLTLNKLTCIYFLIQALTFPTFFYMLVVGGIIPLCGYVVLAARDNSALGLYALHVFIYSLIFLWVSRKLAVLSFRKPDKAKFRILLIIGTLVLAGFLKIHGVGHNVRAEKTAFQMCFSH